MVFRIYRPISHEPDDTKSVLGCVSSSTCIRLSKVSLTSRVGVGNPNKSCITLLFIEIIDALQHQHGTIQNVVWSGLTANSQQAHNQIDVPVLIVGGGPVGQLTALQLAKNGVRCMLVERNSATTIYPKMEYLNMRSMELLARMGLDDKIKDIGVPGHYDLTVLFSTGLSEGGETFSRWVSLVNLYMLRLR